MKRIALCITAGFLVASFGCGLPAPAQAATATSVIAASQGAKDGLEAAAAKAGTMARTVAMSVIGVAFALAAIMLAFRRDFKDAVAAFAVGVVAVLFATPAGVSLLRATVTSLFG